MAQYIFDDDTLMRFCKLLAYKINTLFVSKDSATNLMLKIDTIEEDFEELKKSLVTSDTLEIAEDEEVEDVINESFSNIGLITTLTEKDIMEIVDKTFLEEVVETINDSY